MVSNGSKQLASQLGSLGESTVAIVSFTLKETQRLDNSLVSGSPLLLSRVSSPLCLQTRTTDRKTAYSATTIRSHRLGTTSSHSNMSIRQSHNAITSITALVLLLLEPWTRDRTTEKTTSTRRLNVLGLSYLRTASCRSDNSVSSLCSRQRLPVIALSSTSASRVDHIEQRHNASSSSKEYVHPSYR
jgi:hypothetical protein